MNSQAPQVIIDSLLTNLHYENKKRVKDDGANLLSNVRGLQAKISNYMHNNGDLCTLISFSGTVPIHFQGSQYNIPAEIFLFESYPSLPPKVFVRPTQQMIIQPNHPHVDKEGTVYMPYLSEWNSQSNLVDMVALMVSIFRFIN
jgi:ESCRT-I complex subunit TSG101